MNKKIEIEDFIVKPIPLSQVQDKAGDVIVANIEVSVIKGNKQYYGGDYEIYSNEVLFFDVERYTSMKKVLIRLTELENKND